MVSIKKLAQQVEVLKNQDLGVCRNLNDVVCFLLPITQFLESTNFTLTVTVTAYVTTTASIIR